MGYGLIETHLAEGKDTELYLMPSFSYYGENFFIENLSMGYSLVENDRFIVDLATRFNLDGLYFYQQDPDFALHRRF